jgi:hypothetical protein
MIDWSGLSGYLLGFLSALLVLSATKTWKGMKEEVKTMKYEYQINSVYEDDEVVKHYEGEAKGFARQYYMTLLSEMSAQFPPTRIELLCREISDWSVLESSIHRE